MFIIHATRSLIGSLPVSFPISGRKQRLLTRGLDVLFTFVPKPTSINTPYGTLKLNPIHRAERLLAYAFPNIMRDYLSSDLARYILAMPVKPGDIFADIGANLGIYSLIAARHGMETILFDPEPAHAHFLEANIHLFKHVFPVALAEKPGTAEFHVADSANSGASSLVFQKGIYASSTKVKVETFSNIAKSKKFNPSRVTLMKVDVEGAEANTIKGMQEFFKDGNRPAIWCEVRGGAAGRSRNSWQQVTKLLQPYGYQPHIWHQGAPQPVEKSETFATQGIFDLLYLAKPAQSSRKK